MTSKNVLILGGAGVVGSFISGLFKFHGYNVKSIDKNGSVDLGHVPDDCLDIIDMRLDALEWASIIVFALPEDVSLKCLRVIAPYISPNKHRLINTCSAQLEFHQLAYFLCKDCESVGVNPMFSPTLDYEDRTVVVCEDAPTELGKIIEEILHRGKMKVVKFTPTEHDKTMSVCQGLPHALILAFLFNLPSEEKQLASLLAIAPPPMQTLMCLAARIMNQDPSIYWGIQKHNQETFRVLSQIESSIEQIGSWVKKDAEHSFATEILQRKNEMGATVPRYADICTELFTLLNVH